MSAALVIIPQNRSTLKMALAYAENGWHVFPVHSTLDDGSCGCRVPTCDRIGKHPRTPNGLKDATTDRLTIEMQFGSPVNPPNIGIATGPSGLVVIDIDPAHGGNDSLLRLELHLGALPKTLRAHSGSGGEHIYFRANQQKPIGSNAPAYGVEYPGVDTRGIGGYIIAEPSRHASGGTYKWIADLGVGALEELPMLPVAWRAQYEAARSKNATSPFSTSSAEIRIVRSGEGHDFLRNRLYSMRLQGDGEAVLRAYAYTWRDKHYELPEQYPDRALDTLILSTMKRVSPEDEILYTTIDDSADNSRPATSWEERRQIPVLDAVALYGVAGDFVKAVAPHTEAHPAAILFALLTSIGNISGGKISASIHDDSHPPKLNVAIVGHTSSGAKGTSWAVVRPLIRRVDPDWYQNCKQSGFGSGEAVVTAVAPRIDHTVDGQTVETPVDPRLLITEEEFARVLTAANRDSSTLSPIIRCGWEGQELAVRRSKDKVVAKEHHISVYAHIHSRRARR